jgi:hypothetical protein
MQTGKRGYQSLVGFCSVIIPAKGIRHDIAIHAKPKYRSMVEKLRDSAQFNQWSLGNDKRQFGALQASLVALIDETFGKTHQNQIAIAALALHEYTQDPYFVVEGYYRDGGWATDYTMVDAQSPEQALAVIDQRPSARMVAMSALLRSVTS